MVVKRRQDLQAAADAIAAGRFDAALKALEPLSDAHPERDALLGQAYLGRKDARLAVEFLRRAQQNQPDDPQILMGLGHAYLLAADAGTAVRIFEDLTQQHPKSPDLAQALATAYRHDARYADCLGLVLAAPAPTDQMLYDMALSQARLGDAQGSLDTWDALIVRAPDLAAAWYGSHAPALDLVGWPEAERRLLRAAACPKANGKYQALLAAYDVLSGRSPRSFSRKHTHMVESAQALLPLLAPDVRLFGTAAELLRWAVAQSHRPGLVLEFGVRRGTSLTVIAEAAAQQVHGFDSFEGLPEAWSGSPQGVLSTALQMPEVSDSITLHPGWFEDTLPGFLAQHLGPVRFVNLDSDLYSSTSTVLTALADRIGPGAVLVFDEFIGNRSWRQDEYRAFQEHAARFDRKARIIAVSPACKQVAMIVIR